MMDVLGFQVSLLDRCLKVCHNKTKLQNNFIMSLDLNNVIRSVAIVVVGLPLSGALATGVVANLPEMRGLHETALDRSHSSLSRLGLLQNSKLEGPRTRLMNVGGEVHAGVCKFVFSLIILPPSGGSYVDLREECHPILCGGKSFYPLNGLAYIRGSSLQEKKKNWKTNPRERGGTPLDEGTFSFLI